VARGVLALTLTTAYFAYVFRFPAGLFITLADPSSPPMFFPATRTLGYSHGLVLYAPFYIIARPFLDPLQAYTVALFLVYLSGSFCLFLLFDRAARLDYPESLLLTAFFVTSENVINGGAGVWSQWASVFLIPPILLLGIAAWKAADRPIGILLALLTVSCRVCC
jgi:hypothetical protein